MRSPSFRPLSVVLFALLPACGTGAAADAVRPNAPTLADARGEAATCHEVQAEGTPLIVDWKPEDRGDLEIAMKEGVAVVHYDCQGIRVLSDCHAEGKYGFIGTTKKEQLISLENADQVQANLPFSGGKIGAGMARGSSLDIGLVMVGKKSTTPLSLDRAKLTGRCDGATHFVRSATVGAFAMKQSAAGEVKAAVEVFGVGASGGSSSSKSTMNKDGDVAACDKADPDAPKPPSACGAPVRVQLLALTTGAAATEKAASGPERDVACAKGLVASKGKCVPMGTSAPHDCDMKDTKDCVAQCDAGSSFSCGWAALVYGLGVDVPKDVVKSASLDQKGCDLGSMSMCFSVGLDYVNGEGVPKDPEKGFGLARKACSGGHGQACDYLGQGYLGLSSQFKPPVDAAKGVRYLQRACDGGYAYACGRLGVMYADGTNGVTADPAKAQELLKRGCAAHEKAACARLAGAPAKH